MVIYCSSDKGLPRKICKEVSIILAAGTHVVNVFKLHGNVRVLDQTAEITQVTTLTNCTNVYSDLYDGTVAEPLTANGITLSGVPKTSVFMKDKELIEPYSLMDASQCRVNEVLKDQRWGKPFTITPKVDTDTFIRLHLTTTDDPLSFKMLLRFEYLPLNGGYLEFLL